MNIEHTHDTPQNPNLKNRRRLTRAERAVATVAATGLAVGIVGAAARSHENVSHDDEAPRSESARIKQGAPFQGAEGGWEKGTSDGLASYIVGKGIRNAYDKLYPDAADAAADEAAYELAKKASDSGMIGELSTDILELAEETTGNIVPDENDILEAKVKVKLDENGKVTIDLKGASITDKVNNQE